MTETPPAAQKHRRATLAYAPYALGPIIVLLLAPGALAAGWTAALLALSAALFAALFAALVQARNENLRLRGENTEPMLRLAREKSEAVTARDCAQAKAAACAEASAKTDSLIKSAFIATISHELRTPLNALLGMAQLLERAELPKQQSDHVKVMLEAGRGLQTLIDDIIALTRDDTDQLEDEDCDPLEAARAVARLLQPRAWEKRLHLTLSAASELPRVAADSRKVRQVLMKLTDNAMKFTEHGLVDIRLELADDGQSVRFCVLDTGQGVAPDVVPTLFRPFSPGDSSYARKQQGAGLGLAVAKRVVEQAGGTIGFDSIPGEGAQFFCTLPIAGAAHAAQPCSDTASHTPPTGLSLLLFLRAPGMGDAVAHLLEPFGNHIVQAASMAQAVERAGKERYDAIIAGAGDADMLAAAPGAKAPLIAIMLRGDRVPVATDKVLRWPLDAGQLYRALEEICEPPENIEDIACVAPPAIDAQAFSTLEKSVGVKTLVEILQCYIVTAEQLTSALAQACSEEKWDEATRLAQDIVGAAAGLGLCAITQAARDFTMAARDGEDRHELRNAAQMVVGEHVRVHLALTQLYPQMAAVA